MVELGFLKLLMSIPEFPNTQFEPYRLTSPQTIRYNCIAWACEDDQKWYWPDKAKTKYWPPSVRREVTQAAFIELFQSLNYSICTESKYEEGYRKIVIYLDSNGIPTHAARQLDELWWTSKLGSDHDILHSLNALNGVLYGRPTIFMKRKM